MVLGIDASNIRAGGGITHLVELLAAAEPQKYGFKKVVVFGGSSTLSKIKDQAWLQKENPKALNKSLPFRLYWQRFLSSKAASNEKCNVLFVPGSTYVGKFRPFVTMSQNMLPFELNEAFRFKSITNRLRFIFLQKSQTKTFQKANGLIFLTEYAKNVILPFLGDKKPLSIVIPHGLNNRFQAQPKTQQPISAYSNENPFKLLYVSIVNVYKHQWHVAKAVKLLKGKGHPVTIEFVGPASKSAIKRFTTTLIEVDPTNEFTNYKGPVKYDELDNEYNSANVFIFASSCEAFAQILTEAMSAGLPIACSNMSAMPELLGNAGLYFDPENPEDIAKTIEKLILSPELRKKLANEAYTRSKQYSWERCARETFSFIREMADNYNQL